ncbi:MAG: sodium-dependent transporter [bacterium]|nr:sodium-dependent transporter [bacterium]
MAPRGGFSNRLGFIAAAAGSAVGLGNIWGFPFEVGQGGGGIFVLIYLFFCFTLCLPVMLTEVAIGRRTNKNAVGAFTALGYKRWNFIGKLGVLSGVLILSFYNLIAGWSFGYIFEMATANFNISEGFNSFTSDLLKVGSYALIFMLMTSLVVSKGISGGIEKIAKILMPTLILMILGVVIYSLTLPHSMEGLKFYLLPDLSEIKFSTIYNAMGQAFFSLSLGMGALITYGSYVGKNENLVSSVTFITLADVGIAVLAGLMIFPLVGFLTEGSMSGVNSGPELIFVTLPKIFGTIGGVTGAIVGTFFFILLCFAALTSTVSLMEVPVSYTVDEWGISRKKAVVISAIVVFLVGIPSMLGHGFSCFFTEFAQFGDSEKPLNFLGVIMGIANDTFLPLGGFLIMIFASHIWKKENLDQEIMMGAPKYESSLLRKYMHLSTSYIIPIVLFSIFVTTVINTFF